MMSYWVNFATNGDPNGAGLPQWPEFRARHAMLQMHADGTFSAGTPSDKAIARFKFLQGFLISASTGQQ
jgi:para-nitrobenzyl esterase